MVVTDGPYAETAEQIGGYVMIEVAGAEEAIEFAAACPEEIVEIRPVVEYGG
ncbi:YciI family protein [Planomonospora corallina]|uniref:YciI family protein n=1 Tax=Planomonospora corallina TaxID=1806052 RepID=A0ABV8IE04_9ACTN